MSCSGLARSGTPSTRTPRGRGRGPSVTTNLGTRDISKGISIGFGPAHESKGSYDRMKTKLQEELKQPSGRSS
jgi:hypothetical protein